RVRPDYEFIPEVTAHVTKLIDDMYPLEEYDITEPHVIIAREGVHLDSTHIEGIDA
ncbi:unnamed protein product, partial [Brachionus calyciflorus]